VPSVAAYAGRIVVKRIPIRQASIMAPD
jgi:hypothetical protein